VKRDGDIFGRVGLVKEGNPRRALGSVLEAITSRSPASPVDATIMARSAVAAIPFVVIV